MLLSPNAAVCRCPEQYEIDLEGNPAVVTTAIDVWAWACCMIHMATGMVPFAKLIPQQIMMQVMLQQADSYLCLMLSNNRKRITIDRHDAIRYKGSSGAHVLQHL
jgi:hypothetical protein